MAYNENLLDDERDDVLMMNPDPDDDDAEFGDEGSGATSGYGDTIEDDLSDDDDVEDSLEVDPDEDFRGDDFDDDDDI
ncbi:adhesin [Fibrella arboris]|uniref:adhesin n=1 Tax=Fibrella arboris TaxID=3242486 RepID=UPI003521E947